MNQAEWLDRLAVMEKEYDAFHVDSHLKKLATETETITTLRDFEKWIEPLRNDWCFRGERDSAWTLISKLDRDVDIEISHEDSETHITLRESLNRDHNEEQLLAGFQRDAAKHYTILPAINETVDWLAMMQHYGAPTRLLDWSHSPYVALYFAIEKEFVGTSGLWAIDMKWIRRRSLQLLTEKDAACPNGTDSVALARYINDLILKVDNALAIVPADPVALNDRMVAQQGQLLCNVGKSFSGFNNVLIGMFFHTIPEENQVISRAILKRDDREALLKELKSMKIHQDSLFPGNDEFGKSLSVDLQTALKKQVEERKEEIAANIRDARARRRSLHDPSKST